MQIAKVVGHVAVLAALLVLSGCVSSGTIVGMKGKGEAEVVVREGFVKAGDRVSFYKTECNTPTATKYRSCQSDKVGEGRVVSRSGDRAVAQADSAVDVGPSHFVRWAYPR